MQGRERRVKQVQAWLRHPWNRKAAELMQQIPPEEVDEGGIPWGEVLETELPILRLMQWALEKTQAPRRSREERRELEPHLRRVRDLMYGDPKEAMLYLTTPIPEMHGEEVIPYMEEVLAMRDPETLATELNANLDDRIWWETRLPPD